MAGVFAVYALIIMYSVFICSIYSKEILAHTPEGITPECIKEGRLYEALGTLLASALAFAAGRSAK